MDDGYSYHGHDEDDYDDDYDLSHYDPTRYMPVHHQPDPYMSHSFDASAAEFDRYDPYSHHNDYANYDLFHDTDDVGIENLDGTPLFLAAAATQYLDTTVTKFLENDISVTKFLQQANDITVTKFLDQVVDHYL